MSRKTILFAVFFAVVLTTGLIFYLSAPPTAEDSPLPDHPPAEITAPALNEETVEDTRPQKYILRIYDGYIAIFVPDDAEKPQVVTAIDVRTLPKYDRDALGRGMPVYSESELYSYLEDFGS